jgi:predicted naringenin-chalcone synthase
MSVVPKTKHCLRLNPNFDRDAAAFKMFLHPEIPHVLASYFRTGCGKAMLDDVLAHFGHYLSLAIHPAGPSILEGINEVFRERGWPRDCLADSFATLYNTGNLGSASVLFVLHRVLNQAKVGPVASFAFGPGVTVEWSMLNRA